MLVCESVFCEVVVCVVDGVGVARWEAFCDIVFAYQDGAALRERQIEKSSGVKYSSRSVPKPLPEVLPAKSARCCIVGQKVVELLIDVMAGGRFCFRGRGGRRRVSHCGVQRRIASMPVSQSQERLKYHC